MSALESPPEHPWCAATLDIIMWPLKRLRAKILPLATGRVLEIGVGTGMAHDDFHAGLATLPQIMTGRREGRSDDGQITCFLNNLGLGYQFAAAGYVVNKKAREQGIGHELPTEWFTETVHP